MESGQKLGKRLGPMWSSPSMLDYQVPLGDPRRDEATEVVLLEMPWEAGPWSQDRSSWRTFKRRSHRSCAPSDALGGQAMESGQELGKILGPIWSSPSMLDYQVPLGDPRRDEATEVVVLDMLMEARPWSQERSWARDLGPCGAHQAC